MHYEHFLHAVKQAVETRLDPGCRLSLVHVTKNNGLKLDGLSFTQGASRFSPTIYLDTFYQDHLQGTSIDHIARAVLHIYHQEPPMALESLDHLMDFQSARHLIAFKLINSKANEELLATLPHREFLDLSLVYYLLIDDREDRQMSALINLEHMKAWGLSEEFLYRLAMDNTPRLLPASITSMSSVLERIGERSERIHECSNHLFVLTNVRELAGDACILYPGVLKDFAEKMESSLIIFPSSIHEVLLLTFDETLFYRDLDLMVQSINHAEVPLEERLADHVYLYSRKTGTISIPHHVSVPVPSL